MENFKSENWWASPYNDLEAFRSQLELPKKVIVHDATLRDGEQTPGVVFSVEDKVTIAKLLDSIGVERIEAGMPAVSQSDKEAIKAIVELGLKAKIFTFARAMKEDIDLAVDCGADGVVIEIPTSEPKLKYQFNKWSYQDVIDRSVETIKYAKSRNLEVVYFGYDTTRADYTFLNRLYSEIIEKAKPDSIGIVDTMGCILPGAVKELVKDLKSKFDIKIEIHTHNDFGLGCAISFAAMEGGAEVIHTCINGMGERTGNAALEQIITGLRILYGIENNYNYQLLRPVSQQIQEISNFKMPVNKPIIGDNIFVRESGIGIDLVLNQPLAMFATNPAFTGHTSGVVLGKKSGLASIRVMAERLNIQLDESKEKEILQKVKTTGIYKKSTVSQEEFISIVNEIQGR